MSMELCSKERNVYLEGIADWRTLLEIGSCRSHPKHSYIERWSQVCAPKDPNIAIPDQSHSPQHPSQSSVFLLLQPGTKHEEHSQEGPFIAVGIGKEALFQRRTRSSIDRAFASRLLWGVRKA